MSEFLFSSTAGAIDLAVLVLTALVAVLAPGPHGRKARSMAAVLVAGFLIDRVLLVLVPDDLFPALAGLSSLGLCWALLTSAVPKAPVVLAFAGLLPLKSMTCWAMVLGLDFDTAATVVTVIVYLQMVLVLGGAAHGMVDRVRTPRRGLAGAGIAGGGLAVEVGVSPASSARVPFAGGTTAAPRPAAHRQKVMP